MSFRQANWLKHMQALRRAILTFYAFDRINYKRWAHLYHEDCLALPNKFPELYEMRLFVKGILLKVSHSTKVVVSHWIKL